MEVRYSCQPERLRAFFVLDWNLAISKIYHFRILYVMSSQPPHFLVIMFSFCWMCQIVLRKQPNRTAKAIKSQGKSYAFAAPLTPNRELSIIYHFCGVCTPVSDEEAEGNCDDECKKKRGTFFMSKLFVNFATERTSMLFLR